MTDESHRATISMAGEPFTATVDGKVACQASLLFVITAS